MISPCVRLINIYDLRLFYRRTQGLAGIVFYLNEVAKQWIGCKICNRTIIFASKMLTESTGSWQIKSIVTSQWSIENVLVYARPLMGVGQMRMKSTTIWWQRRK